MQEVYYTETAMDGEKPTVYPDATDVFKYLNEKEKMIEILSTHPESNLLEEAENYELLQFISLIKGD